MAKTQTRLSKIYFKTLLILLVVVGWFVYRLNLQSLELKKKPEVAVVPDISELSPGFESPRSLDVDSLKKRAKRIGLETNKFNQCLDSGAMADRVSKEMAEAASLDVHVTPSFIINGILVVGTQTQPIIESIIEAEIENGKGLEKSIEVLMGEVKKERFNLNLTEGYMRGTKDAQIKMVEFVDFECSFCIEAFPMVKAFEEKYKGKISLEYKSLLILPSHQRAQKAAEAALCAGEQGKFWELHDDLLTNAE